jgi:hypothetical protein
MTGFQRVAAQVRLVAATTALLLLPACKSPTLPTPAQLTCSVETERLDTRANFEIRLTGGPDVSYQASIDFGDGVVETRRMYRGDSGSYPHRYDQNGRYVIDATVRNEETNDRLNCSREVEFDVCRSSSRKDDDFGQDLTLFWSREAVADSPTILETKQWRGSGGNPGGYRVMTHEFTATTSPNFVSMFVYHIFDFGGPERGPIDRIRYREDRIKFAPSTATSAVGSGAVILQNGVYHVAPLSGGQFSNQTWETLEVTLRASDFTPAPDFSASAPPMLFGYLRSNSNRFPLVIEHGIDNWRVEICR